MPVMASVDPFCPVEVETYTYGPFDELRINKVYQLLPTDDPSGIPTEDFEHGGRRYYLLGMVVEDTDSDMVTYTAIFGSAELTSSGASGQFKAIRACPAFYNIGKGSLPLSENSRGTPERVSLFLPVYRRPNGENRAFYYPRVYGARSSRMKKSCPWRHTGHV